MFQGRNVPFPVRSAHQRPNAYLGGHLNQFVIFFSILVQLLQPHRMQPGRIRVKVAIPRMGESVAPCFEYCATMAIFTVSNAGTVEQVDFPLQSREPFDRVRLLRDQKVDTVICGGMQCFYEDLLKSAGFEVISWVSGAVEELLGLYLRGGLVPGTELPGGCGPDALSMNRMTEH